MIKQIDIQGVKGVSVKYDLAPFTAITGPNFSGKTAIADAIRLALIGYVPSLGKRNQATMQLADGDTMSVTATFTDGKTNHRKWTQGPRGVKLSEDVDHEWPAEILDIGVWLAANQAERIRMVAGASGASEELAKLVSDFNGRRGIDTVEKLEAEIAGLKEALKVTKAQAKTYEQTLRGGSDIDTDSAPVNHDPDAVKKANESVFAIRQQLLDAHREQSRLEQADHAADDAAAQLASIETLDKHSLTPAAAKDQIAALRNEMMVYTQTAHDLRAKVADAERGIRDYEQKIDQLEREKAELEKDEAVKNGIQYQLTGIPPTGEQIHWAQMAYDEAECNYRDARVKRIHAEEKRNDLWTQMHRLDGESCCPTCKNNQDGWQRHARAYYCDLIDKLDPEIVSLTAAEEAALDAVNAAQKQQADQRKLTAEYETVAKVTRRNAINLDLFTSRNILEQWQAAHAKAKQELEAHAVADQSQIGKEIEKLERLIDSTIKADSLQKLVADRPTAEQISEAMMANDRLQSSLLIAIAAEENAAAAHRAWIEQEERARMMAEARSRYDALNEEMVQANHQIDTLSGILLSQQEALWGAINRACKAFSSVAVEVNLEVRNGEIGARTPAGSWIPYDALSGSEQIIAAAAVQIALCERAPAKILMLDELSRMTHDTKAAFAAVLQELLDKKIVDQVIVVDWDTEFWADHKNVRTLDIAA